MTDLPCSDAARLRGDTLLGTAPPARRWLLVEQDGGWLPSAFGGLTLDPGARAQVTRTADRTQTRILLIRRPGRRPPGDRTSRAWCVVDPSAYHPLTWGTWTHAGDLVEATDLLSAAHARHAGAMPVPAPAADPELLLVCTHGRKDVCCAVRGRPVAAALAQQWPEATWECSHTGGDRFAANLVVLPGGVLYGGLDPETVVDVVRAHHTGSPSTSHLRGAAGHPPAVQAAIAAGHAHLRGLAWGSISPVSTVTVDRVHTVLLAAGDTRVEVTVTEEVRPPHRLTCQAPGPGRATVPVVDTVRTITR